MHLYMEFFSKSFYRFNFFFPHSPLSKKSLSEETPTYFLLGVYSSKVTESRGTFYDFNGFFFFCCCCCSNYKNTMMPQNEDISYREAPTDNFKCKDCQHCCFHVGFVKEGPCYGPDRVHRGQDTGSSLWALVRNLFYSFILKVNLSLLLSILV